MTVAQYRNTKSQSFMTSHTDTRQGGMERENCRTSVLVYCLPFGGTSWASLRARSLPRGYVGRLKCL